MIKEAGQKPNKRFAQQKESRLQAECFTWAWNERPITRRLLFHVPNENDSTGSNAIKGAMRRSMGGVAGVADLLLLRIQKSACEGSQGAQLGMPFVSFAPFP